MKSSSVIKTVYEDLNFRDLKFTVINSIKFRWFVAAFLLILPIILPAFKLFIQPIPIIITAGCIFLYNGIFYYFIYHYGKNERKVHDEHDNNFVRYNNIGRMQIFFDYFTLAVVLYFIGAIHTNLFYIIIFHIIIGAIILSIEYMLMMALITIIGFFVISLLEINNIIPSFNLYNMPNNLTYKTIVMVTLIHTGILFSVIFMISKLTARIKADNKKLSAARDTLEGNLEAIKALELRKSKFMRYSAHQLRSPLATIISALDVLYKKLVALESDRAFNLLTGAYNKAKSLLAIVNDLLELSRIREGRKELVLEDSINPIEVVEEILFSLNQEIHSSQLYIVRTYIVNGEEYTFGKNYRYKEDFNEHIANIPDCILDRVNQDHVKEAFYNIIENAVKYSELQGNIYINCELNELSKKYIFIVKDEGIGIDKDYIDDIFFEFVRSPNAKDFKNEGTGLGLAIVKEILDVHNAEITCQSSHGQGTSFKITFKRSK